MRGEIDELAVQDALDTVTAFRAAHQYPLIKANNGLRSMVRTAGCKVEVSQRLKRMATILDKIRREPTMAVGNMQDVGGCRAVLDTVDEVRRVEHRLRHNRSSAPYYDYITTPRASGYRGVHVVVTYADENGADRLIEVQLRTRTMHEWAFTVERLSGRLQNDLKSGVGPASVLDLLGAISEAMALEEAGVPVPDELLDRMRALRTAAVPYLGARP
jgi:ppGpp synthetase/RelA/SpoT-type nucleotidyltranferase